MGLLVLNSCHPNNAGHQKWQLCTIKGPTQVVNIAGDGSLLWPKKSLSVWFMDDDGNMEDEVFSILKEWTNSSGVRFTRAFSKNASDIRVTFRQSGWWSYIGTASKDRSIDSATLCLDSLYRWDQIERKSVILHEFGHSLGLIHEHQSKSFKYKWNKDSLYAYYKKTYNVKPAWVDDNVISVYDAPDGLYCEQDLKSIMIYQIPKGLLEDPNMEIKEPLDLSPMDKKYIKLFYQGKGCNQIASNQ